MKKPYDDIVTTKVCGIPARVKVMIWPGYKGATDGYGQKIEPDEDTSVEIMEIQDRNGRRASWLERKLDGTKNGWHDLQVDVEEILSRREPEPDWDD